MQDFLKRFTMFCLRRAHTSRSAPKRAASKYGTRSKSNSCANSKTTNIASDRSRGTATLLHRAVGASRMCDTLLLFVTEEPLGHRFGGSLASGSQCVKWCAWLLQGCPVPFYTYTRSRNLCSAEDGRSHYLFNSILTHNCH